MPNVRRSQAANIVLWLAGRSCQSVPALLHPATPATTTNLRPGKLVAHLDKSGRCIPNHDAAAVMEQLRAK